MWFALQHAGTIVLIVMGLYWVNLSPGRGHLGATLSAADRGADRPAWRRLGILLRPRPRRHGEWPIRNETYQVFIAAAVITMLAAPFLLRVAPVMADYAAQLPVARWLAGRPQLEGEVRGIPLKDHVIIAGFGVNGRNVARALAAANIPYLILEMNPETVRVERGNGAPIAYGDAAHEAVLRHAYIEAARVVVVAISDAAATRRVVELARRLHPGVYLIARTRYSQEVGPLSALGANEAIPEEFETSIEIFARVLRRYLVPREDIERQMLPFAKMAMKCSASFGRHHLISRNPATLGRPGSRDLSHRGRGTSVGKTLAELRCASKGHRPGHPTRR
jgi:voltage-gated potassium channel Kch